MKYQSFKIGVHFTILSLSALKSPELKILIFYIDLYFFPGKSNTRVKHFVYQKALNIFDLI